MSQDTRHKIHSLLITNWFPPDLLADRLASIPGLEVCSWTRSPSWEVSPLLDRLDPEAVRLSQNRFIFATTPVQASKSGRLLFVKDLRILGRPLERTVLLDASPEAGLLNPWNCRQQ